MYAFIFFQASSLKPRRVTYKRKQKQLEQSCNKVIVIDDMEQQTVDVTVEACDSDDETIETETDDPTVEKDDVTGDMTNDDIEQLNNIYEKEEADDEFCVEFRSEGDNCLSLFTFARDS